MFLRISLLHTFLSIICLDAYGQIVMIPIIDQSKSIGEQYYIDQSAQKNIFNSESSSFLSSIPFIDKEKPLHFKQLDIHRYGEHTSDEANEMLHYLSLIHISEPTRPY